MELVQESTAGAEVDTFSCGTRAFLDASLQVPYVTHS